MPLVIKKWVAGTTPNADGNYVHIIGREAGLVSWLLSLMQIDPTTEVEIKENLIVFTTGSLAGKVTRIIPIKSISSASYGYEKPWQVALLITILLSWVFFLGFIAGPLYYFLNKNLSVAVLELSGVASGFSFKRSVIESENISEKQAYEIIRIIRMLIERDASSTPATRLPMATAMPRPEVRPPPEKAPEAAPPKPTVPSCGSCKAIVKADDMFCGSCGFRLTH